MDQQEKEDAIATLKAAYLDSPRGKVGPPPCNSADCLRFATTRVFWPVLPDEEYPVYCDAHAAWARLVMETLGHKYRDEALPPAPWLSARRSIVPEGGVGQ